jgi:hypothetical protein
MGSLIWNSIRETDLAVSWEEVAGPFFWLSQVFSCVDYKHYEEKEGFYAVHYN